MTEDPSSIKLLSIGQVQTSGTASSSARSTTSSKHQKAPQVLRKNVGSVLGYVADAVIVLLSLSFLVYGGLLLKYDHVETTSIPMKQRLDQAAHLGPTIFPILFAAIVGRALIAIALWRLERGECLGLLDQMLGSTTLFGTLSTHVKLRAFNAAGLGLIALWVLSPIGGQASLRVLSRGTHLSSIPATIDYIDTNNNWTSYFTADDADALAIVDALYVSSLASPEPIKVGPIDTWGNVKIPMLERLETPADNEGWHRVSGNRTTYASLIGLPISNYFEGANSTFNMETFYWLLNCPTLMEVDRGRTHNLSGFLGQGRSWTSYQLVTNVNQTDRYSNLPNTDRSDPASPLRRIMYQSWDKQTLTFAECTIETSYVEVSVSCSGLACGVTRIRDSTINHPPRGWTCFDIVPSMFGYFAGKFTSAIRAHVAYPSPVQNYFLNPGMPFDMTTMTAVWTVGPESFATSLAQLMNTFWMASIASYAVPARPNEANLTQPEHSASMYANISSTSATVTRSEEVLVCHKGWLLALFLTTSVMLAVGLLGLVAGISSRAPDIAMNMSSMTKDNPFVNVLPDGSTLGSTERSRKLRNVRVRYGDVSPDNYIGHIAVGLCSDGQRVGHLKRKRLYT